MIKETKNNHKREHNYEVNCLISLRNEGKIEELTKKMQDWIEKRGGSLLNLKKANSEEKADQETSFWVEKRKLAYPIKKDYFGCYLIFWFKLETAKVVDFKKFLSLERDLLRSQVFCAEDEKTVPTDGFAPLKDLANLKIRDDREKVNYEKRERPAEEEKKIETKKDEAVNRDLPVQPESVSPESKPEIRKEETTASEKKSIDSTSETVIDTEGKVKKDKDSKKQKKITLEELDDRLDDILNEEII